MMVESLAMWSPVGRRAGMAKHARESQRERRKGMTGGAKMSARERAGVAGMG
jgi:hypothetical protein